MSSATSSELPMQTINHTLENNNISGIMDNSEIVIQNHSPDLVISKFENSNNMCTTTVTSTTGIAMKAVPVVYIQSPFTQLNKSPNNIINVNNLQFSHLTKQATPNAIPISNVSIPTTPNVIFAPVNNSGKSQLVIQKQNMMPVVPVTSGAKISGINLTMIKPVVRTAECSATNKEGISLLSSNSVIQNTNTNQKILLTMPKMATNHMTVPATKLMPVPMNKYCDVNKLINFKLSDTSINDPGPLTIICDDEQLREEETESSNMETDMFLCDDSSGKTEIKLHAVAQNVSVNDKPLSEVSTPKVPAILKDQSKFSKHGISILKKSYSFGDKKSEKPNNLLLNSKSSLSDNVRDLTLTKASTGFEEPIVVIGVKNSQKPERRRKSNFSYRKDYDDMEISIGESLSDNKCNTLTDLTAKPFNSVEAVEADDNKEFKIDIKEEDVKEQVDINMNDECDLEKMLQWEDGIGCLPGSQVKFIINEFGLLEYVTEDEHKNIIEKKNAKEKMKSEYQEEMRCEQCGCYGQSSEFINPKYCSYDCQDASSKSVKDKDKFGKKRKKGCNKVEKDQSDEEEEENSMENSQDKYFYPWACTKKGFSWSKYLEHVKAKPAPVKLFKDAFPYTRNGFRPGMKLEGVDPQHPSYFCVLSVAEAVGYRIRLHFDGYPENYDFWINADSMDIFPMGWCEKHGHVLQPPPGYTVDNFNWVQYLKFTKSTAAPKHLFCNRAGNAICPNGFRVGMKLEAVDRKNTSLVCVASIRDMMDNRILVHFDSWDDIYDYWADPTSPYIHPVGWCDQYGHNLTPPNDYPNPESFTWELYLKETKSVAAPVRAFKQRPACGFKNTMRLECVDKRVPQLIRVAMVTDVKEHQIRISFDGWPDRYSYWVDDDSPDIHPMGWCQKTGHPIEPPLTPDDVYDFLECPTVGCRGLGDIRGPKYATHSSQEFCPYAEENIDSERTLPDRLLSPDRTLEAVIPVSREPREKPKAKVGRPPKNPTKVELANEYPEKKPKKKYNKRIKLEGKSIPIQKALNLIEESETSSVEKIIFKEHTGFLKDCINCDGDPRRWTKVEVAEFVSSVPTCQNESDVFKEEEIDGEALLSLSQKDLLNILNIKVGPAIKLYNSIVLLRQHINNQMFI